jgi:sulfoxide reductase heme-binding subunit YedZ
VKDPTFWILARATGLTAYLLLTASVLAGLTLKARVFATRLRPAVTTQIHRTLSFLGLGAIALHAITLVLDSTVQISLVIPGIASYRPLWTGLGVVAAELMGLVAVSFSVRRFIGFRVWRRLHWATYAIFALATVHGLAAGSDSGRPWVFAIYLGAIGSVVAATTWRAMSTPQRSPTLTGSPSNAGAPSSQGALDL